MFQKKVLKRSKYLHNTLYYLELLSWVRVRDEKGGKYTEDAVDAAQHVEHARHAVQYGLLGKVLVAGCLNKVFVNSGLEIWLFLSICRYL